jgi:hydroxybutyrate-dimer hydrolase
MNQRKSIKLISIIVLASLLNGCDSGQGLILGIMAIGAVSGLWNAVKSHDDNKDNTSTSTTSSSQPTDNSTTSPTPTNAEFVVHSTLRYPGGSDDLLTAGLGQTGLIGAAPVATDPANPTAAEIRRATIVNEYQAMQDLRSASGYGTLYGSAVPTKFVTPSPDGQVSGSEYLAYADDGSGRKNVTLMVQVPDNFDRANPCIIAAPSPGSRGVYGAIGIIGEWGLKNHCAIAYTDKGTGNGVHELFTNTVNRIDGTRGEANDVGKQANFSTQGTSKMDLAAYNSAFPYRIAQKHAHSQQNPEANWGNNVLDAIRFAFQILIVKTK